MSTNSSAELDSVDVRHKDLMDRMYGVQRHFYDASRAYYLLGRDELIANLNPPAGGTILEIGCGTGRNLVHAAKRYPAANLCGIDISSAMLETAGATIFGHDLIERIRLAEGDACVFRAELALGIAEFDRIFFSYALSMVPDWQGAIRNAVRHLSHRGELHIVDFGPCDRLPGLIRTGLLAWLRSFHVTPRNDLGVFLRKLAAEKGLEIAGRHSFLGYAQNYKLFRP
jgi:S-adenosylmethionine-diacylgycerolhomoserine-N-methlytransferase